MWYQPQNHHVRLDEVLNHHQTAVKVGKSNHWNDRKKRWWVVPKTFFPDMEHLSAVIRYSRPVHPLVLSLAANFSLFGRHCCQSPRWWRGTHGLGFSLDQNTLPTLSYKIRIELLKKKLKYNASFVRDDLEINAMASMGDSRSGDRIVLAGADSF